MNFVVAGGVVNCAAAAAKSLQSCLTLCDPIDGSPPGSAIPGILQARTLEWVNSAMCQVWPCFKQPFLVLLLPGFNRTVFPYFS